MKGAAWTKGPWVSVAGMVEHPDDEVADICSCYTRAFDQGHLNRDPAEEWANANLIAEAPAMYEALEALLMIDGDDPEREEELEHVANLAREVFARLFRSEDHGSGS
jgi:hypothetical protein